MSIPPRSGEAAPRAHSRRQDLGFGHSPSSALLPPDPAHVETIAQSHARCAALGLSRIEPLDAAPALRVELETARTRHQRLLQHAVPLMELLLEQIVATQSMVLLADTQGTVLHSVGEARFLERASRIALAPGTNWAESSRGTNGIGTTLVTEAPTVVHADEHYLHAIDFLTCSAAPIFDPRGNLLGVLDVTGDHRSYHLHTMGLVKMSARMIENHCLADDFRDELRLHFHHRPEFIGTLSEGIVAVGRDGRLLGANRSALDQLGMSGAALRMNSLAGVFGATLDELVDHFRSAAAAPMRLCLGDGRALYVQARVNWPLWHSPGSVVSRVLAADWTPPSWESPRVPPSRQPAEGAVGAASAPPRVAPAVARPAPARRGEGRALAGLQTGDAQMDAVVSKLRRVLDREISVMILGETGTGKELLARATHDDSSRAAAPFVAVNCASIPEALIEAELFGYEDGAFTGARRKGAVGKIAQADGGTLFLDEIGDMPLALQARLLRVLQERQVTPLGSVRATRVDLSIICATHRNLREMIARGEFREDLYYRLNGLVVKLPPLRERGDLLTLAQKILREQCEGGGEPPALAPEVLRLLKRHAWPGNIRQLVNVLRTAAVMAEGEALITRAHLSDDFLEEAAGLPLPEGGLPAAAREPAPPEPAPPRREPAGTDSSTTLEQVELRTIFRAVEACRGNISEASKRLGISRTTIYRRLRRYGGPSGTP
ncbi:sigma-54-dependent Fis family transcriptional regulator [Caldimonas tepidiphila]|uniref:sigma-54-dependent Fis family transcriptional regulator n=1 Tax=Caldimonas tepidiphila TaxID=2315841 RepID=UPI000E5A8943|nr:sigma-54-dependent Fis family transcriptional regulator [Caldimonas tepidiphila]